MLLMIIIAAETFVQHSVEIRRWILDIDRKTRRWKILQQRRRRQWWNDARIGDSLTLAALSYQQAVVVFAAMTCRVFFLILELRSRWEVARVGSRYERKKQLLPDS